MMSDDTGLDWRALLPLGPRGWFWRTGDFNRAEVRRLLAPEGYVFVNGALWSAWTDQSPLQPGELVEVVAVDGLRLFVRPLSQG